MYFVLGIIINKYARKKEGFPELIPNHSHWADFPFLVKVGYKGGNVGNNKIIIILQLIYVTRDQ